MELKLPFHHFEPVHITYQENTRPTAMLLWTWLPPPRAGLPFNWASLSHTPAA